MPSESRTDHVRKRCDCSKWKDCTHPWYVDYQEGKRRYRPNLDSLIGRHAADFTEAKREARRAIDAWLDGRSAADLLAVDRPTVAVTLAAYRDRPNGSPIDPYRLGVLLRTEVRGADGVRPFGDWRAADVTTATIEQYQQLRPLVAGNRDLQLLRAMFNWAVRKGLVPSTPFRIGNVAAVKLAQEEPRTRRLQPGEEDELLTHANSLRDLIVATLETGCRLGELLSLQWHQVRGDLFLPAGKTKAKKPRRVPISTVLRGILDARRLDPAGEALPPSAYVFGDEVGRRRGSIKTAWRLACGRAVIVGLHFHDLRREAGSRWMDAGVPLATIQRWLGHHNISQTSTYPAASGGGDGDAMRAYELALGRVTRGDVLSSHDAPPETTTTTPAPEFANENLHVPTPAGVIH